jgi:lysozyme
MSSFKTSQKGINLITSYESCQLEAYNHGDVWTIGWGHTAGVHPGMRITKDQADAYLKSDLHSRENSLNNLGLDINQDQFDALMSFIYNCGFGAFCKSTLYSLVRGNPKNPQIAKEFLKYNKSRGKVLQGLTNRRKTEADVYFGKPVKINFNSGYTGTKSYTVYHNTYTGPDKGQTSIFFTDISPEVKSILDARKAFYSTNHRDSDTLNFLYKKTAYCIASSIYKKQVVTLTFPDDNNPSSTGGGIKDKGLYQQIYRGNNTIVYYPKPVLVSAGIESDGDFGSLQTANISFTIFTMTQLESIGLPFMTLGNTLNLEYGWIGAGAGGNGGSFTGYIKDFSYRLNEDGSFACSVSAVGRGIDVITSEVNSPLSSDITTTTPSDSASDANDKQYIGTGIAGKLYRLMMSGDSVVKVETNSAYSKGASSALKQIDQISDTKTYFYKSKFTSSQINNLKNNDILVTDNGLKLCIFESSNDTNPTLYTGTIYSDESCTHVIDSVHAYEYLRNDVNNVLYANPGSKNDIKLVSAFYSYNISATSNKRLPTYYETVRISNNGTVDLTKKDTPDNETDSPATDITTTESKETRYEDTYFITLQDLNDIINDLLLECETYPYPDDHVNIKCVAYGNMPKVGTDDYLISADPGKVVFPGYANYGGGKMDYNNTMNYNITLEYYDESKDPQVMKVGEAMGKGYLAAIELNVTYILECLQKSGTDPQGVQKSAPSSIADFYHTIFNEINADSGGRFNLSLVSNPKKEKEYLIINSLFTTEDITEPYEITCCTTDSICRSADLSSNIPSDVAAAAAIEHLSTSQKTSTMGVQILKGNTSSQIQDKASLITTAQSQAESLSGLKESEKDLYAQTVTSLRDTLKSLYVSNPVGSFIIPLNFSFTLDGIEGFIFGNSITCNYLPSIYRDKNTARCGFTVTKVHHSIQRNDWTTTIDTCFRVFYTGIKQENKSINGITQNNTFTENTYTIPSIDQTIAIASGHPGLPTTKTSSSNTKTLSLSSAIPENSNIKLSSAIPGNSK